ncbi:MAG TPA: hypothetical protein IAB65_02895 [Candidatus Onthocola stercorigallinarum]|nr:hypothetical protein [Candidatus Onthocola stercorigallinarum]
MLEDLNIVNGELTPEFDIYNNIYSVSVAGYVDELVIDYEVTDGYVVNVIDNHDLVPGENEVYIQVIKNEEINTYTLLVNKKSSEAVVNYDYLLEPLEVEEELPEYVAPLIGGICFFIILCTFLLLFKKKKKHKKTN